MNVNQKTKNRKYEIEKKKQTKLDCIERNTLKVNEKLEHWDISYKKFNFWILNLIIWIFTPNFHVYGSEKVARFPP